MRKIVLAALFAVSTNASATGIPVVDVLGNAELIKQTIADAKQFADEMKAVNTQIDTAKDQYNQMQNDAKHYTKMVEGTSGWYQHNFNGLSNLNDVIQGGDWQRFYNSIDGSQLNALRHKYKMIASEGEDSPQQAEMDTKLKELAIQDEMYSRAVKRNDRLKSLKTKLDTADTPQQREELSNAIQLEGMQMQNDQQLLMAMSTMQHVNAEQERREAYKKKVHNLYSLPSNH